MAINTADIRISGIVGVCGSLKVFLGFTSSRILYSASFADVLDEETGFGYQRPRDRAHSLSFKNYITRSSTSTIPLTFNLRGELSQYWSITELGGVATLRINQGVPCLAQVDCQHRIGELADEEVSLAFMAFIGLDLRTEMSMFTIINSKARGLSSSLTDYHRSNLLEDIISEAPELYLSRRLNEDPRSPWFGLIVYGGNRTSGLKRKTSLRMMQKAIKRILAQTRNLKNSDIPGMLESLISFWNAVAAVFSDEWKNHRSNLLTKGVGLHALSQLFATILTVRGNPRPSQGDVEEILVRLKPHIDWSSRGTFSGSGGQKGASEAHEALKRLARL